MHAEQQWLSARQAELVQITHFCAEQQRSLCDRSAYLYSGYVQKKTERGNQIKPKEEAPPILPFC